MVIFVGAVSVLPVIVGYSVFVNRVFGGKASLEILSDTAARQPKPRTARVPRVEKYAILSRAQTTPFPIRCRPRTWSTGRLLSGESNDVE